MGANVRRILGETDRPNLFLSALHIAMDQVETEARLAEYVRPRSDIESERFRERARLLARGYYNVATENPLFMLLSLESPEIAEIVAGLKKIAGI
jgi:hypothetical protein